ncbi:MAG: hypothetical protein D3910_04185, partial [Candidatus Electrothrix sp. ATG2]|nr:hypothetical protein [Candidatus Electrothrix sp. ATG2]
MSLIDLANTLRNQLPATGTGSITLNGATLATSDATNSATLIADISAYLGISEGTSLIISGLQRSDVPVLAAGDTIFSITTGDASFLNIDMSVTRLKFELHDPQTLLITLQTGNFPESWTLAVSFPALVVFPLLDEHLSNPSYIFFSGATASHNPWAITPVVSETLSRGLNFYSELAMSIGPMELVQNFSRFIKV